MNAEPLTKEVIWNKLSKVDVTPFIKVLQKSKYISWSDALKLTKDVFPTLTWGIVYNKDELPYVASELGIWVRVWVQIGDMKQEVSLPVLNTAHKTLKLTRYSYFVNEYVNGKRTGKMVEKWVEAATSFDVNTAHMRGLVKCLANHGLGINIYQDAPAPAPERIGSAELQQIMDLINAKGITLTAVTTAWNMEKIAHLHLELFNDMIEYLNQV